MRKLEDRTIIKTVRQYILIKTRWSASISLDYTLLTNTWRLNLHSLSAFNNQARESLKVKGGKRVSVYVWNTNISHGWTDRNRLEWDKLMWSQLDLQDHTFQSLATKSLSHRKVRSPDLFFPKVNRYSDKCHLTGLKSISSPNTNTPHCCWHLNRETTDIYNNLSSRRSGRFGNWERGISFKLHCLF